MTKSELTKELVGKTKSGDKSAFGELYAEYSEQIKRFVMRMNITELDAEDIVADTFAEAMEHIEDLENDSAFSTWLHSIAKRKVYAKTGREQRHGRVSFNSADDDMQNDELDILATEAADFNCDDSVKLPHDYAENEEIKQILADTVNELKPEHRDSIFMFYYENKSLNEIAEEMNVPVGTVKSRLNNGRKALSKKCEALIKKGYAFSFVPIPVLLGVLVKESKLKAAGAVTSTAAASTMAGGAASGAAVSAISGKIGAVIAAAVMLGAGTGVYFHYSKNADKIHKKPKLSDSSMVDSSKQLPDSQRDWNPDLRKYQQRDVQLVYKEESEVEPEPPKTEESSTADVQTPTGNTQPTQGGQVVYTDNGETEEDTEGNEPSQNINTSQNTSTNQNSKPNTNTNNNNSNSDNGKANTDSEKDDVGIDSSILPYLELEYSDDGTVIIISADYVEMPKAVDGPTDLVIPEMIDGHIVRGIGPSAFHSFDYIDSITLPDTIEFIGDSAFYWCLKLQKINIPENVTIICDSVFGRCMKLQSIKIPNSVTQIEGSAFLDCDSLKRIDIPDSVIQIGVEAFSSCDNLESIILPYGITEIKEHTFSCCESLKSITIPNSVEEIGKKAFLACTSLTSITIPESVKSFGEDVFTECSPDLIIKCKKGSYAETYAKEHNINYEYY